MTIKYAILGFLSWKPLTGYELKKRFAESSVLPWSGNSNQIYRTLVELHRDELVTVEVQHQESLPSRKVYTITDEGRAALREWVLAAPEPPQVKSSFLVQLAWADQLAPDELDGLLEQYEEEIAVQLSMAREEGQRNRSKSPGRTERERYLWQMIAENRVAFFEHELNWLRNLRRTLGGRRMEDNRDDEPETDL